MISFDTNIAVYALNRAMPGHGRAYDFLSRLSDHDGVIVCELVLVELYLLIRNPAVFVKPYSSADAVEVCRRYRSNPRWRIVECEDVMDQVWTIAGDPGFARRRIVDARLAFTLLRAGVTELATRNVQDFRGFGFERVWDPTAE